MKAIFINGLSGKMGKTIKNLILNDPDFEIVKTVSDSDLVKSTDIIALIRKEVDTIMGNFSNYERVKEFALLDRLLTLEKGELTPTLKVVRKVVLSNFSDTVDKIYSEAEESKEQLEPELV